MINKCSDACDTEKPTPEICDTEKPTREICLHLRIKQFELLWSVEQFFLELKT
jgi:hypothetical protein